ncbi:MAG: biosynthetic peptidoglycan transglycosylase [Streptosporangiaceae bacterium]
MTVPLRARRQSAPGPQAGQRRQAGLGGASGRPGSYPGPRRRAPVRRLVRAVLVLVVAGVLLGGVAFGGLLLVTPSVGNAPALVRAQNRAHHAVYPGPWPPPRFTAALEATEDHRFNSEPGVDPFAIVRVAWSKLTGGGDQGGATLYQQLAKVLYTPGRSGLPVELEQVALAVKLKFSYTGRQILRMYSSVVYFGHGFYGLRAASCGYFGVRPGQMSWPQVALLAGLVQAPSADDPLAYPAAGRGREVHVIGRLVATGALTQQQASAALAVPLSRLTARAGQRCLPA